MNSTQKRALFGLAVAGLILFAQIAEHFGNSAEKLKAVTAFGRSATGTSAFHQWLIETKAAPAKLARKALLHETDLGTEAYAILSPRSPVTARESKQLHAFVQKGGKLILSFHDIPTRKNLAHLVGVLGFSFSVQEAPAFENGKATVVEVEKDDLLFKKGEKIAFYSADQLGGFACALNSLGCFREIHEVGKGTVLLLAGLPFFSNGLIGLENNAAAALRLARWGNGIAFDEFHHFFSDRTWVDLLLNLSFSLPLLGLLLLLILFFVFGHTRFHQKQREVPPPSANSMHDWNEGIVTASVTNYSLAEAMAFHRRSLQQIFKRGVAEPLPPEPAGENRRGKLKLAADMLRSHQNFLLRKRKVLK